MRIEKYLPSILVIALSSAFLWFFSNIWRYGKHFIQEPNRIILIGETVMLVSIFSFGIYTLVRQLKE